MGYSRSNILYVKDQGKEIMSQIWVGASKNDVVTFTAE
jgi:hypothetical protein